MPLILISNLLSIIVLLAIFFKYVQYKKKLNVVKGLDQLKDKGELTEDDKTFIKQNLKDYKAQLQKSEDILKLSYPILILCVGILLAFMTFSDAVIHLNVIVVVFIYLQVTRLHNKNFVEFLKELNKDNSEG